MCLQEKPSKSAWTIDHSRKFWLSVQLLHCKTRWMYGKEWAQFYNDNLTSMPNTTLCFVNSLKFLEYFGWELNTLILTVAAYKEQSSVHTKVWYIRIWLFEWDFGEVVRVTKLMYLKNKSRHKIKIWLVLT